MHVPYKASVHALKQVALYNIYRPSSNKQTTFSPVLDVQQTVFLTSTDIQQADQYFGWDGHTHKSCKSYELEFKMRSTITKCHSSIIIIMSIE